MLSRGKRERRKDKCATLYKIYPVLPDDATADGDLRVIDESGEDYLYSAGRLVLIDLSQEVALLRKRECSKCMIV